MQFVPFVIGVVVCAVAVWAALRLRPSKQNAIAGSVIQVALATAIGTPCFLSCSTGGRWRS